MTQSQGFESNPQSPIKEPGMVPCTYNLNAGEERQLDPLELAGQLT